jgi:hypothetical protein
MIVAHEGTKRMFCLVGHVHLLPTAPLDMPFALPSDGIVLDFDFEYQPWKSALESSAVKSL